MLSIDVPVMCVYIDQVFDFSMLKGNKGFSVKSFVRNWIYKNEILLNFFSPLLFFIALHYVKCCLN